MRTRMANRGYVIEWLMLSAVVPPKKTVDFAEILAAAEPV